tara:strand:- start:1118 stop:1372 length:255 start_codon:yes stop_codon:yes gene_type:complete
MTGYNSKRQAAQAKLDDDSDTLLIVYQRGFADGKQSAQRKPLTGDEVWKNNKLMSLNAELGCSMELLMEVVEAIEAAHGIKEGT